MTAELPGLEQKDVEILLRDNVLALRGERRSEHEDKQRYFSERYYGQFERSIALPVEVDPENVQATFENGVLTVKLRKSAQAQEKVRRIPISY